MTRLLFTLALLLMPCQALAVPGVVTDVLEPFAPGADDWGVSAVPIPGSGPTYRAAVQNGLVDFFPSNGYELRTFIRYQIPQSPGNDWILERAELVIQGFIVENVRRDPDTGEPLWDLPDVIRTETERVSIRLITDAVLPEPIGPAVPGETGLTSRPDPAVYDVTPLINLTPPGYLAPTPIIFELRAPQSVIDAGIGFDGSFDPLRDGGNPRLYLWWSSPAVKTVESSSFGEIKALYGGVR